MAAKPGIIGREETICQTPRILGNNGWYFNLGPKQLEKLNDITQHEISQNYHLKG